MVTPFSALNLAARRGGANTLGTPAVRATTAAAGVIGSVTEDPPNGEQSGQQSGLPAMPSSVFAHLAEPPAPAQSSGAPGAPGAAATSAAPSPAPSPAPSSAFAHLAAQSAAQSAAQADSRRNLSAMKVLSRLVAAIAKRPGSGASQTLKASHLAALLKQVNECAHRLATSVAPLDAHRGWVRGSATQAAAHLVASQWEAPIPEERIPLEQQVQALEGVFSQARQDESLSQALDHLGNFSYEHATSAQVADQRVQLSVRLAAWDLYQHVTSAVLGQGSYRFTYQRTPAELVGLLLPHALSMAREAQTHVAADLDVATAHLQSCIRQCADLLGTEYVSRTRALMNWVTQDDISTAEFQTRRAEACESLQTSIVPAVVHSARSTFQAIEAMASSGLEEPQIHSERPLP